MTEARALEGVRVLEIAMYVFGPAAGAVLSDWGADVIKIEHPKGDPVRSVVAWGYPPQMHGLSYLWELSNRGKRDIAVDVSKPEGRALVLELAKDCDVFLTSLLPATRRRFGVDVDDVMAVNPRVIYARASGGGPKGPEAEAGGFDGLTYWARSGAAASVTPEGSPYILPMPGPGFGDIQSGAMLAGGICAALFRRERTGKGGVVDASLLATGMWAMQPSIAGTALAGADELPRQRHTEAANPLANQYRTSDGRFVSIGFLQPEKYWPRFCEMVGHPEWLADPRFGDMASRSENRHALIGLLDAVFAEHPLEWWKDLLSRQEGQWEVAQVPGEVRREVQAVANGYIQSVERPGFPAVQLVPAPVQFDETAPVLRPAPTVGEHSDAVLKDHGIGDDRIAQLRADGVIS